MIRTRPSARACSGLLLWLAAGPAASSLAGDASLGCSAPNNTSKKTVTVTITYPDGKVYKMTAEIAPGDTAVTKRNKIADAVDAHANPDWRVERHATEAILTIKDLPKDAVVDFDPSATGEAKDHIVVPKLMVAAAGFEGTFDPFDYQGLPAIFTAGIVTDVGELSVHVSAAELDFQTDGPIICQALFQRLAPLAPPYGANVLCAGDRLEVYFDPAYSLLQGGVVFGTTSTSPGCHGSVLVPEGPDCNGNGLPDEVDLANGVSQDCNRNFVPDECDIASGTSRDADGDGVPDECELRPGDMDCDGAVTFADIDLFVEALAGEDAWTHPDCPWLNADCNGDGQVDFQDIDPFVALLTGG